MKEIILKILFLKGIYDFLIIDESKSNQSHLLARLKTLFVKDNLLNFTIFIKAIESTFSTGICTNTSGTPAF
jgi:hypothetical protein